jgi:hypothetical protein
MAGLAKRWSADIIFCSNEVILCTLKSFKESAKTSVDLYLRQDSESIRKALNSKKH